MSMSSPVAFYTELVSVRSRPIQEMVEMAEVTPLDDVENRSIAFLEPANPPQATLTLVNKIAACTETEEDVGVFIDQFSDRFPFVGRFCCCSRLFHRSFTLTALALLYNLHLKERVSLVLGFWFVAISIMIWLFGSANKLVLIILFSMVIGVLFECKCDDKIQTAAQSPNDIVKMATAMCKCGEEITYILMLLLTVPFSMLQTIWLTGLRFGGGGRCYLWQQWNKLSSWYNDDYEFSVIDKYGV